jgi:hypothetical protein
MSSMTDRPLTENPLVPAAALVRKTAGRFACLGTIALGVLILVYSPALGLPGSFYLILLVLALVIAGSFLRAKRSGRTYLVWIFTLALTLRLVSSLTFQLAGQPYGDDFSGSPDGWKYHTWSVRAGEMLLNGELVDLARHDRVGSWEVGFYYILGSFYLFLGTDPAVGRLLVCLFGALTVLALHALAREILDRDHADLVAFLYAIWPSTIAWTGYSILRDSIVWLLVLLAVLLGLKTLRGSFKSVVLLIAVGVALRFIRAYAWYLIAAAFLGAIMGGALVRKYRQRAPKFALPIAALVLTVVAVEATVHFVGYPNAVTMLAVYAPERFVLKPVPTLRPSDEFLARAGSRPPLEELERTPPATGSATPAERDLKEPPTPSDPLRRLAANAVRFLLGPFAWTFDVPASGDWLLPTAWFWYAILPAVALGFVFSVRERYPVGAFLVAVAAISLVILVMGRGDSFRQREMLTPGFLMAAVIGLARFRSHRSLVLASYLVFAVLLVTGMIYHRHSLRERGMISLSRPPLEWSETAPRSAFHVPGCSVGRDQLTIR